MIPAESLSRCGMCCWMRLPVSNCVSDSAQGRVRTHAEMPAAQCRDISIAEVARQHFKCAPANGTNPEPLALVVVRVAIGRFAWCDVRGIPSDSLQIPLPTS